jgi:hypothetical protein
MLAREGSGHPATGLEMANCIIKAVVNMGNQGLDEQRSVRTLESIPEEQYAKGFLGELLSKIRKQIWLKRKQLTNQTELLHWIISPER